MASIRHPVPSWVMAVVSRFNVTPVKGTALGHPDAVTLTSAGIPENRRFFLVDERGELFSGSRFGPLVQVRASVGEDGALTCTFPDGQVVAAATDDLGDRLVVDFYGRPVEAREVRGPFDAAFSDHVSARVRLVRADRDGDGADVLPLTIVGDASVAELGHRGGFPGDLDSRRFRINVEVEGTSPFEEDTWDGLTVQLGEALIRVAGQIPRCVVTTEDPDTGVHDWNTLKQIAAIRPLMPDRTGIPFGMYAEVVRPGRVAAGAPVAPLDI
jgi:uncharacterized protein YcbX